MMFLSGGQCLIRGMKVDGQIVARKTDQGNATFTTLVRGVNDARITLSGIRAVPFPPEADPNGSTPGFVPVNGPAVVAYGRDANGRPATFYFLDRPMMPVYPEAERQKFVHPDNPDWGYEALWTWDDNRGSEATTPRVRVPMAKAKETLTFGVIAAGSAQERTVAVDEAREGDLVTLGPPSSLPVGLIASGLVKTDGEVTIRLHNATGASVTPPAGTWTVAVGGGPQAGFPQETDDLSVLVPPYGARPEPTYE